MNVAVGDEMPQRRLIVSQQMIDTYAVVSGDRNPLHVDPEFAATTAYGRTIAHGLLTLAIAADAMAEWSKSGWYRGGGLDIAFVGPVFGGEELTVSARVIGIRSGENSVFADCELSCQVEGRLVVAGTAWRRLA